MTTITALTRPGRFALRARKLREATLIVLMALLLPASAALAISTGPQPGNSGVPAGNGLEAEPTCIACHTTAALNPDDKGSLTLEGVPATYEPGKTYTLTFRIAHSDPTLVRWGFQITAVTMPGLQGAGQWVVTDSATTQTIDGMVAGRSYLGHSYGGTAIGQASGASWTFGWTAPPTAIGPIGFFAAANAANADGSNQGDRVYSQSPMPLAKTATAP